MPRTLTVTAESFPIRGSFTISRGSKRQADVLVCEIREGNARGRGESVPYPRYGETHDSARAAIEDMASDIANGITRQDLIDRLPAGAARNAIDCALWDIEAKTLGRRAHVLACRLPPRPVETAFTISLGTPEMMTEQARSSANLPLIKIKLGGENDAARIHAVAAAAPSARFIVDANEGWTKDNLQANLLACARHRVVIVEQPLPAGDDDILRHIPHPVPICADESVHTVEDLDALTGLYDCVNIKLDKAGGLTAALILRDRARERGFGVLVGCMVSTSLAMAPALLLAQDADLVDLDGPLLLARDREPALRYSQSLVSPPSPELWG